MKEPIINDFTGTDVTIYREVKTNRLAVRIKPFVYGKNGADWRNHDMPLRKGDILILNDPRHNDARTAYKITKRTSFRTPKGRQHRAYIESIGILAHNNGLSRVERQALVGLAQPVRKPMFSRFTLLIIVLLGLCLGLAVGFIQAARMEYERNEVWNQAIERGYMRWDNDKDEPVWVEPVDGLLQ